MILAKKASLYQLGRVKTMLEIPKQLNNFRFIKTVGKTAIEKGFPIEPVRFKKQEDGSYFDTIRNQIYKSKGSTYKGAATSYTYLQMTKILSKLNDNSTYGVLCGFNGLVVVDIDDKKVANKLKRIPPFSDTFTISSASKGLEHFYFKCEPYSSVVRYDSSSGSRLLDVQGMSTYVIGGNSKITIDNKIKEYKITNNSNVVEISFNKLKKIIEENIGETHTIKKKEKNIFTDKYFLMDPISEEIFKKIDCDTILDEAEIDISSNPGDTPFAKSKGKKCLHRTKYMWFDHHTQQGGTVVSLYAKINNIDTIDAKYALAERVGVSDKIFKQAMEYFIKNQQHEMTELISMKFLSSMPVHTIRSDKHPEIYVYKKGIYIPEGETVIKEFCDKILGKWYSTGVVKKIIDKIIVRTYISAEKFFKEADVKYVAVQNGIINLDTDELLPFTPKLRFFNKLPVKYNPKAKCNITIEHYKTVLHGENDVLVMQELYGYLLYRDYRFEKAFMLFGTGRNGKSKSIEQIHALIGQDNSVNISIQELENEKFARCNLHRKLANLADDIGNGIIAEAKIFKQMTGHSMVTVDRKNSSSISFTNYAKMIFSANKLPDSADDTEGFWNRWILLGFEKRFWLKNEYNDLIKNNNVQRNYRLADTEIIKKLTTPEELSGVLNWALEGLKRLIANNGFTLADSHNKVKQMWKRHTSTTIAFKQDQVIETHNPSDFIVHEDLYKEYIKYCQKIEKTAEEERIFKKQLQSQNFLCTRKHVAYGFQWRWIGLKLKESLK
jgi:P4 family phage/plasmid primase-like protien